MKKKILYFEGAGCVPRGDLPNCRIRTAFYNDRGTLFYLEVNGFEVNRWTPDHLRGFENLGSIMHCRTIYYGKNENNFDRHKIEGKVHFEYSEAGLLKMINDKLCCSFTDIFVGDLFDGYRVHGPNHTYIPMESYPWNPARARRAREAFADIDQKIRDMLGEKYSKISLSEVGEDTITVYCYADARNMAKAGLDPDNRYFTVKI